MAILPDIIAYRCQRELRAISFAVRVSVFSRHRTGSAIGTAQAVHADHEETRYVKGSPTAAQQGPPPVAHIGTACQSMANDHRVVCFRRQLPLGGVCHGNVMENMARLKSEGWDDCYFLVRYQSRERVLRLRLNPGCCIQSPAFGA